MSEFLDTLQDTVLLAGKGIGSTAKEMTARAKLQYEIKTREGYLNELYQELGKRYYAEHKDDEKKDDSLEEIEKLLEELKDLRHDYLELRGAKKCPHCGAQVDKASDYCGRCGRPLFDPDKEDEA